MGAGVATGPHCPSSMARLPARRPAGRVVHERAGGPFDPPGGSGAAPKRRPFPSGLQIAGVSPLSFPRPVGRSGQSRLRLPGFPSVAPGLLPLRFPGAIPHPGRSPGASRPPVIPRQAAVSREPAIQQASLPPDRAVRGWRPRPPLPLHLRKAWHPQGPRPRHTPFFSGTFEEGRSLTFRSRSAAPLSKPKLHPLAATFLKHRGDSPCLRKTLGISRAPGSALLARAAFWRSCPRPLSLPHARLPSLPPAAALPAAPPSRGTKLLRCRRPVALLVPLRFLRVTRPATGTMLSPFASRAKRNRAVDK
jgi:hypothetical protein